MVQQFKVPETESELRQLQDKLYSITKEQTETGAFRGFRGLLEIMASETVIMTAIHNIKANKGAETAGTDGRTMRADILQQDYTQIGPKVVPELSPDVGTPKMDSQTGKIRKAAAWHTRHNG